jgi:hypothetical protein
LTQILVFLQQERPAAMTEPENNAPAPLSWAGWVTIIVLLLLLVGAVWYAVHAWTSMADVHMSVLGWVFLCLGVVVTFAVGAFLMGLVFYSAHHDMDR